MNTEAYINNYKQNKKISRVEYVSTVKRYKVAGESLVECRDACIKNGRYGGIRLSDIYIFDPNFLHYLINSKYVDDELKQIAAEIRQHQSAGIDSISTKIALGKK